MRIPSLFSKFILSFLIPAIVLQPLYGMHDMGYLQTQTYQDPLNVSKKISYDEVLKYLEDIESGALESVCHEKDLEAINNWLIYLARAGVIPGDLETESLLEADIEELSEDAAGFEYAFLEDDAEFSLIPSMTPHRFEAFICKSWLKKQWKQTKKFVKDHKKEILIGAAIIVGAAVVVACVSLGAGAAAATAVGGAAAGASESNQDKDKSNIKASDVHDQTSTIRQDVLTKELAALKDQNFPLAENARLLGQASAQAAFEKVLNSVSCNTYFSSDLEKMGGLTKESCHLIDKAFSKPVPWYMWDYSNSFKENVYAARGAYALDIHSYAQAFSDFGKALELNSKNSEVYLNRAVAYFNTGQMQEAHADFQKHVEFRPDLVGNMKDFTVGFSKGMIRGAKDSFEGLWGFSKDLICHPVSTSVQMYESGKTLFELTKTADFNEVAHLLSPEAYELATLWDSLSFDRRGELCGYVFGKHGADFLLPAVGLKTVAEVSREIKVLSGALSSAKKAESVYAFESAISTSKASATALENVGAGFASGLSEEAMLVSIQKFQKAKEFLSPYKGQYMPEAQLRNLIKEAGLEAIPRPKGIPENFRVKIADKGSGIIYMHPEHEHTSIRVMFGMPHSPNQMQQKAYVVMKNNGKTFDKMGNPVHSKSPEAHIPLEEFLYKLE